MDLSPSSFVRDPTVGGWPALVAWAAARAAATPTALCQARLPARAEPGEVAFDAVVAAAIRAWRSG